MKMFLHNNFSNINLNSVFQPQSNIVVSNLDPHNLDLDKQKIFKNGYLTLWKEVSSHSNPVFHTIPIYPFKSTHIVIGFSLQLDKCPEGEIVKLGCDRFFKLDLSKEDKLCGKFSNKTVYLISNNSQSSLTSKHSNAGINFRTPVNFDFDVQHYFKIVGDNSDLYSVNVEIANLKV